MGSEPVDGSSILLGRMIIRTYLSGIGSFFMYISVSNNITKLEVNMAKKSNLNISKTLADKIPYLRCYEECGIIETQNNVYTRGYEISNPEEKVQTQFNIQLVRNCMESILKDMAVDGMSYQFCVRNRRVDTQDYLKNILALEHGEEKLDDYVRRYNDTICENTSIGHNNFETKIYYIISYSAEIVEDAIEQFEKIYEVVKSRFQNLYGYIANPMSLVERLESIYDIFHPENKQDFGKIVDYDGNGFSFHSMQLMKLTTKDLVAPSEDIISESNYLKIGNSFARALFINSVPMDAPDTVLTDIMGVSSNSVLSVLYQPMESEIGFNVSAREVKENTYKKVIPVRDTVEDRKARRTKVQELPIYESEQTYFQETALELYKESVAKGNPTMLTSFVIVLFADDLKELDRDTRLLKLSASKYAVQIRTADKIQLEAFQSVLPLNNAKIDVKRTFSVDRLTTMPPINVQALFEQIRAFHGLNAINDNLVLIDRQNYMSGMITGIENSGKTFACKRECFNALISTNDEVIILTKKPQEYKIFTQELGGSVVYDFHPDFVDVDENFNLTEAPEELRKAVLEACITYGNGFYKKKYKTLTGEKDNLLEDEKRTAYRKVEAEAERLKIYSKLEDMLDYASENFMHFEMFLSAMDRYMVYGNLPQSRLKAIHIESDMDMIIKLSYFLDYAVRMKKKNKNIWLFVDGADELLYSTTGSDFLIALLERTEKLHVPVTLIIDDSVHIFTNQDASIEFEYLLNKMNYFKLFGLGPIERKQFIEKLNIADTLVPYITDREPGEGIILTSTSNIAFTDRLGDEEHLFYKLFY